MQASNGKCLQRFVGLFTLRTAIDHGHFHGLLKPGGPGNEREMRLRVFISWVPKGIAEAAKIRANKRFVKIDKVDPPKDR